MAFDFRGRGLRDRGSLRGAKRYIVTGDLQILDHALAKQQGIDGIFFQSGAEAKRWVHLCMLHRAGHIRNLRRQVKFPLHGVRPDGLKEKIGSWTADHVYEEKQACHPGETGELWQWVEVVEDVKPSGGHREDLYLWKKAHWQVEYGRQILEWTGRR